MTKKLVYRGAEAYLTNPFVTATLMMNQATKKRILANQTGGMMVVNRQDQAEVAPVSGFWATEIVDNSKFVKLYKNGVRAFKELTSAGFKVFEVLYDEVQNNIGKGEVLLSFKRINQDSHPMCESTFQKGVRELVKKNFLAKQPMDGLFWVNPDFIFNGDRLAFVQEYFRVNTPAAKEYLLRKNQLEQDQNQAELPLGDDQQP